MYVVPCCRGDSRVKSNIVNNLCKDILYTWVEVKTRWKDARSVAEGGFPTRRAGSEAPDFAVDKFAGMRVEFRNGKVAVASDKGFVGGIRPKFDILVDHSFA